MRGQRKILERTAEAFWHDFRRFWTATNEAPDVQRKALQQARGSLQSLTRAMSNWKVGDR